MSLALVFEHSSPEQMYSYTRHFAIFYCNFLFMCTNLPKSQKIFIKLLFLGNFLNFCGINTCPVVIAFFKVLNHFESLLWSFIGKYSWEDNPVFLVCLSGRLRGSL